MSRFSADTRLSAAQVSFALNPTRAWFRHATAIFCGALLAPLALADEHAGHNEELSPTVITAIAPSSPLTIVTNPKDPRQPVPASDGGDYLKTIPGFALVRNGGTNGDPVLRGMFGSRLNILTNGGMMLGACPGRMDAPTSYISPETYDKLTVIKGPQTVLWGPGASAGTILFDREPENFGARHPGECQPVGRFQRPFRQSGGCGCRRALGLCTSDRQHGSLRRLPGRQQ
jgi:iron complex outermembrane recepter protein